jgi:hypothetical protein
MVLTCESNAVVVQYYIDIAPYVMSDSNEFSARQRQLGSLGITNINAEG